MTEQESHKELHSENSNSKNDEVEIDLMDLFRKIISIRKTIYKAAGIGVLIGIIVSLSIPKQYTVKVTLSPEIGNSKNSNGLVGLAASFLGNGVAPGDVTDALNISLSEEIVSSTPFLLELFSMKVDTSKTENITLATYLEEQSSPWWSYIIGFPVKIIDGVKNMFTGEGSITTFNNKNRGTIELSKEDAEKITLLKELIGASVDKKNTMTSVSVTLQDPRVAAVVADSVVQKLQEVIINYRTSKAKEDCIYLEKLFEERQQEYYTAQKKYADYLDSHDNLILQSVRAEQERLQNDMNLAYQVYSQVANQLQVARAKVQEEKPVFAIVEPAVVPQKPSGIGLKIYLLLFMFLAVLCTVFWKIFGITLWSNLQNSIKEK